MRRLFVVSLLLSGLAANAEESVRFDAGRLLMERHPSKALKVEDNVAALEKGTVPDYAVGNVIRWLEFNKVDCARFRERYRPAEQALGEPLARRKGFRLGFMLDISRNRIPTMATLKDIVDALAAFGYNEFQLYNEVSFAYSAHPEMSAGWSPMTADEIRELDDYCWARGIVLTPNQNSFGHLEKLFRHKRYLPLAEAPNGFSIKHPPLSNCPPSALCATDPKSLDFLDGLYDEFFPLFRHTDRVHVGCDEVWDIFGSMSRSAEKAAKVGVPRVYTDFLLQIGGLCRERKRRMMFWADMMLLNFDLLSELPKDSLPIIWGYGGEDARYPGYTCEFEGRCLALKRQGLDFYVAPSDNLYGTFFGKFRRAKANVDLVVAAGRKYGASGLLLTSWGDGGHRAPWIMSLPAIAYTAAKARGEEMTDAQIAAAIDRVLGCRLGEMLVGLGSVCEPEGAKVTEVKPTAEYAAALRAAFARGDRSSLTSKVRSGYDMLALGVDMVGARADGTYEARAAEFGRRFASAWLRDSRPGGLRETLQGPMKLPIPTFAAWADWPVLKTYDAAHQRRIRMPMGGIGTGSISLSGVGGLVDWEIRNAPNKGFTPCRASVHPAFVVRTKDASGTVKARLLEGPLDLSLYEGAFGCSAPNHGYPRFRGCTFRAAYPLAMVELSDAAMPVRMTLEAMNPLVRGDSAKSGMPVVLMRWKVENATDRPIAVTLAAVMPNPAEGKLSQGPFGEEGLAGIVFEGRFDKPDPNAGSFAVVVPEACGAVARATQIRQPGWSDAIDQFWRRLVAEGDVCDTPAADGEPCDFGALAVSFEVLPGEVCRVPFALAWRFPHRAPWEGPFEENDPDLGNFYCTRYASAWAAAADLLKNLPSLETETVSFVDSVLSAKAPDVVKEAALFNLSTLRTTTCHRTADGHFWGWEGVGDKRGSCKGNCTHVWGYEHALVELWPDLAKDMRELEFGPALDERGHMSFRIGQPLERNARITNACADGQMQSIVKVYECWRKTGDDAWLRRLWPNVRKALAFAWVAGGWDADRDGVMEGCQHNTMDVEYYGPNPQMEFLYLAALEASARMADAVGEVDFAGSCRDLKKRGSTWTEENLFNGAYYEHLVLPPKGPVAEGLRHPSMGAKDLSNPDYQLAAGCLVDQLVGDYAARAVGLGPVADLAHARRATETILRRNRREPDDDGFNHMRDFVLAGERSLKMAWYPEERRPKTPFPYYGETMTGFEYVVAAWLAQTGDFARATEVVKDIRDRYDGLKRNPFDEAECGHHYARALAAWSVLKAFETASCARTANMKGDR